MILSRWFRLSIVALAILLTVLFALYVERLERARTFSTFEAITEEARMALINRLDGFVSTLDGAAGLLAASDLVRANDWRVYVGSLDLENRLSGIRGVGYVAYDSVDDDFDIVSDSLARGQELPPIHPVTGNDERFILQLIEPAEPNQMALGLDMSFEEGRKLAALRARDTNTAQLTPPVVLVQGGTGTAGFVLMRPYFETATRTTADVPIEPVFRGWVTMPFVADELFQSLTAQLSNDGKLTVQDGSNGDEVVEIFASSNQGSQHDSRFDVVETIDVFGRSWTLRWESSLDFEQTNAAISGWIVFTMGLIMTWFIALTLRMQAQRSDAVATDVAKKTMELRAKTEETQSVIDNAVLSIFVLDEQDRIILANRAARELFKSGEYGDHIEKLISFCPDAKFSRGAARPARAIDRPELSLMIEENAWQTADGISRTTLLVQDVSGREDAARRLEEAEARWNLALQGAAIGVYDVNLQTQDSIVSTTWLKLMELPLDTSGREAQRSFHSRVHPDDVDALRMADEDCIAGRSNRSSCEFRMRFDDGSYRWMKSDGMIVERDSDKCAVRLLGAQTDITALRDAEDSLRESRKRFEMMFKQAPVGMAIFNSDGRFQGMNDALCRMTGYSEEEMRAGLRFRNLISYADLERLLNKINDLKQMDVFSYQSEYQIIPKSGPLVWGLLSVAWTTDPLTEKDVFIVQISDINEKKNMEKMKSEFVATVSHELRTPLTSIKGALGLMSGPMLSTIPEGVRRLLEIATSNADRLATLVNDILDMEKIDSGEVSFHIQPFCIGRLLTDAVEQLLPFSVEHKVAFALDLVDGEVCALIDPERTLQLIVNLLSNACKYSGDNTTVHVQLRVITGHAMVCVANTGPPIPNEFRARIFQPFSQADASDTRIKGGTGLGLNISRQIVERMDGEIGYDSQPGSPTVFWFTVPLAPQGALEDADEVAPSRTDLGVKVLHVENDLDFVEIVERGLDGHAAVTVASSVADADRELRKTQFDVVVIDCAMMNGHDSDFLGDLLSVQPDVRIMSLSVKEPAARDLRVDLELLKSRADLEQIVTSILKLARVAPARRRNLSKL